MAKKVYNLEFVYSGEDEVIKEYSIEDININDKDKLIEDTCNKLIHKEKSIKFSCEGSLFLQSNIK